MKNPRGEASLPNNSDCRTLAPFVMTLFDGEADEFEARRARAHLLVCQTCARRWLDWNRSRDLLRTAPVPAPPPQLLWRVLMACRLSRTPQRAKANPRYCEALPADFKAQILARTVQASQPRATDYPVPRRVFSWQRTSTLAVPALAIWMMVLQRDSWLPTPVSETATAHIAISESASQSRARLTKSASRAVIAPRLLSQIASTSSPAAKNAELPSSAKVETSVLPNPSSARRARESATARAVKVNRNSDGTQVESIAPERASTRLLYVASNRAASVERFEQPKTVPISTAAPRRIAASLESRENARATRNLGPVRSAIWSDHSQAPRLRAARWQNSTLRARQSAENEAFEPSSSFAPQTLRVSMPSARAMQPGKESARLLAENFESDDERVDEIRSVVDDFRATLDPDASNDAGATDDNSDGTG